MEFLSESSGESLFGSLEKELSSSPPIIYYSEVPDCLQNGAAIHCEAVSSPTVSDDTCSPPNQTSAHVSEPIPEEPPPGEITTLVFLDLETTGLGRFIGDANVHITEISMIAVSRFDFENSMSASLSDIRVINKLTLCVKPRTRVSVDAAKITGLSDSDLYHQQHFDENIGKMIEMFIARLPQPVCLIAHNGDGFDFPLLMAELLRVGITLSPKLLTSDSLIGVRAVGIPELKNHTTAKKKNSSSRKRCSYGLENLYRHFFKKKAPMSHSSESDCRALMMVCHKMKDTIMPWLDKNKKYFSSAMPMW